MEFRVLPTLLSDSTSLLPSMCACSVLANGDYYISNVGGATCNSYLSGAACGQGDSVALAATEVGQVWSLTYLPAASTVNTYLVTNKPRLSCNQVLSAPACSTGVGLGFASQVCAFDLTITNQCLSKSNEHDDQQGLTYHGYAASPQIICYQPRAAAVSRLCKSKSESLLRIACNISFPIVLEKEAL